MNKDVLQKIHDELLFIKGQQQILATDANVSQKIERLAVKKFTGRSIGSVDYILEVLLPQLEQDDGACERERAID